MSYVDSDIIYDQKAERSIEAVTRRLVVPAVCGHDEHTQEYGIVTFQCRQEPPPAACLVASDYHLEIINRAVAVTCT